jgi:hypothetical protein
MIEITIPYWFTAYSLGTIMALCLIGAAISACLLRPDLFVLFMGVMILFDIFAGVCSSGYMSSPTNGYHFGNNVRCVPFGGGPIVDCIYPTVNPYEQQPIHPIAWMVGFFVGSSEWIHSAVSVNTEVK